MGASPTRVFIAALAVWRRVHGCVDDTPLSRAA